MEPQQGLVFRALSANTLPQTAPARLPSPTHTLSTTPLFCPTGTIQEKLCFGLHLDHVVAACMVSPSHSGPSIHAPWNRLSRWLQKASHRPLLYVSAPHPGSIPGLGRSTGKGNGNPLQYSCLENPRDGGAWKATVHGVAKSQTQLNN